MFNQSAFQISRFIRTAAVACLLGLLALQAHATTYEFWGSGNWTDETQWVSYPGTTLSPADEVIINGVCNVNEFVDNQGKLTINNTLQISKDAPGGMLICAGELRCNAGLVIYNGGELHVVNFIATASAQVEIHGNGKFNNTGTFNNSGKVTVMANASNFKFEPGATFNNLSGGNITMQSGGEAISIHGILNNHAGANISNARGFIVQSGGQLTNSGLCAIPGYHNWKIQNYGTVTTQYPDRTLWGSAINREGGIWNATNELFGTELLHRGAELKPGGNSVGTFKLLHLGGQGGKFVFDIAGTGGAGASNGHDQINVDGTAQLNVFGPNVIEVKFINGFVPNVGDAFEVVTFGTYAGSLPPIVAPPGYTVTGNTNNNKVTLTVTARP